MSTRKRARAVMAEEKEHLFKDAFFILSVRQNHIKIRDSSIAGNKSSKTKFHHTFHESSSKGWPFCGGESNGCQRMERTGVAQASRWCQEINPSEESKHMEFSKGRTSGIASQKVRRWKLEKRLGRSEGSLKGDMRNQKPDLSLIQTSLFYKILFKMSNTEGNKHINPSSSEIESQIDSLTKVLNNQVIDPYREASTLPVSPIMRVCKTELNRRSVVVKLLDGEMNFQNLKSAIYDVWNAYQIDDCVEVERGILQIWFHEEKNFRDVVVDQPWIIAGHILQIAAWEQYKAVGKECFRSFYVWMMMVHYPSGYIKQYMNGAAKKKIILENLVDSKFFTRSQIKTVQIHAIEGDEELAVRIRLSMHTQRPIPPGFKVPYVVEEDPVWVPFAYECLPCFCFKCGILNHHKAKCSFPEELASKIYSIRNRVFVRPEGSSLLHQHQVELVKLIGDATQREQEFHKWWEANKHLRPSTSDEKHVKAEAMDIAIQVVNDEEMQQCSDGQKETQVGKSSSQTSPRLTQQQHKGFTRQSGPGSSSRATFPFGKTTKMHHISWKLEEKNGINDTEAQKTAVSTTVRNEQIEGNLNQTVEGKAAELQTV